MDKIRMSSKLKAGVGVISEKEGALSPSDDGETSMMVTLAVKEITKSHLIM